MHTYERPMNQRILLLGANGRTGRLFLEGALAAGHDVTAVVRSAERLAGTEHAHLSIRVGSATDATFLERTARDHDVIVSTLGPRWPTRSAAAIYPESGIAMVAAARSTGVRRLLVTSSALLFAPQSWTSAVLRRLVWPIVDGAHRMEAHIRAGDTSWTLVRTSFLTDTGDPTRQVGRDALPEGAAAVSRIAVADFLLRELGEGLYRRHVVGLCGSPRPPVGSASDAPRTGSPPQGVVTP